MENYLEDKMSFINPQQLLKGQPETWVQTVSQLPLLLQQELLIERPQPTQEDIEWVSSWQVESQPITVNIKDLLQIPDNLCIIANCPVGVVREVNQKWELQPPKSEFEIFRRYAWWSRNKLEWPMNPEIPIHKSTIKNLCIDNQPKQMYEQTPNRYTYIAQNFTGATAKPSVMVDRRIIFGCGRFISALLRGDQQMMGWDVRTDG